MGAKSKSKIKMSNGTNGVELSNGTSGRKFYDPMAVTWSENYSDKFEKVWKFMPGMLGKFIVTFAIFGLGISINGNFINLMVHIGRQLGYYNNIERLDNHSFSFDNINVKSLKMTGFLYYWTNSLVVSYGLYIFIGGFLHWYYYVRQRDSAEQWKCQPNKWLTPDLERHEIILGSATLFMNATISAVLATYIVNGGYSTVYYKISDYGTLWFILQFAAIFIYQDYCTYWLHRIYHTPFLYKNFHKLHHKYKQPTAFSVTAIHPVESLHIQLTYILPLFLVPTHWFAFYTISLYAYYHGIIDHSGVNFKSYWWQPWQPDAIFHDNHHQYFHVNFAFNIEYWDKLHGTYRRKDRVYTENIFYGTGKALNEVSEAELKADLEERKSENPLAYRDNKLLFDLTKNEVQKIKKT